MRFRKPIFTRDAGVDCEVEHPKYGWIPFHATPDDVEPHGREIFAACMAGEVAPYVPPTQVEIDAEQDASLDAMAAEIDQGQTLIRVLAKRIFKLEKAANPDLTAKQFKASIRADLKGF